MAKAGAEALDPDGNPYFYDLFLQVRGEIPEKNFLGAPWVPRGCRVVFCTHQTLR